jgi:hypothetical protein
MNAANGAAKDDNYRNKPLFSLAEKIIHLLLV